jgi:hypothetical protein
VLLAAARCSAASFDPSAAATKIAELRLVAGIGAVPLTAARSVLLPAGSAAGVRVIMVLHMVMRDPLPKVEGGRGRHDMWVVQARLKRKERGPSPARASRRMAT